MPDICQSSHNEYKIYVHMQLYNMFSYLSVKPFDSTLQCLWQVLKCLKNVKDSDTIQLAYVPLMLSINLQ